MQVSTGVVKRLLVDRGFGFIGRAGVPDVFFHVSACIGETLPREGDRVEFDIKPDVRPLAVNVRLVGA